MWIESINIRGFGCLVDRRFDFPADRATLVIADNETGKSTLAAAILAALCGFPKRRQTGETVKLSDVYKPWNSEVYAVEMDLTVDGRRLHVERDFAKDTFIVRDAETRRDISAEFDKDLAAKFLRLPREDFMRIAFISGKDTPSLGETSLLRDRLTSVVEGSDDSTGAELAMTALDGARYTLDTGGPLAIPNAIKRLRESIDLKQPSMNALETALDEAGEDTRSLDDAKAQRDALTEALQRLDAEYRDARAAEEQANAHEVERLRSEIALGDAKRRLSEIEQERKSGKQHGASILVAGVAIAAASFCLWMLQVLSVAPSIIAVLVGIAIAAAGAVRSTKADVANADEKSRLETQMEAAAQPDTTVNDIPRASAEIDGERRHFRSELDTLNSTISELTGRVGAKVDAYQRDYATLREELTRLRHELAKAERYGQAIEAAKSALREVAEDSRRRWAAALNRSATAILPHLNPDYDDLRFDDSLAFTIRHVPDDRTLDMPDIDTRISTGAKDQVYLAVRLACCEELSRESESIPVLLDDPLMAADDSRFATGLRYLVESFAKDHQTIILSCSKQRHDALTGEPWLNVHRIDLEDHQCLE